MIGVDANEPIPSICPASPCPAAYPRILARWRERRCRRGSLHSAGARKPIPQRSANTWTWFGATASTTHWKSTEPSLQPRAFAARRLYLVESARRRRFAEWTRRRAMLRAGIEPLQFAGGPGTGHLRCEKCRGSAQYTNCRSARTRVRQRLHRIRNAAVSGWTVNSIVTPQGGFPFTPQLSYNPSNNGDNRNPVRPFINPAFSGSVIEGNPAQWFNPAAFIAPPNNSGFYGNLGRDTLSGPGWRLGICLS